MNNFYQAINYIHKIQIEWILFIFNIFAFSRSTCWKIYSRPSVRLDLKTKNKK